MIITQTPYRVSLFGGMCYNGDMSRLSDVSTERVIELYKVGNSCNQVADLLGTNYSVVWRRLSPTGLLRDKGYSNRGRHLSIEHRNHIAEGRKQLLSNPEIKDKLLVGVNNPFYGHKHKRETIERMKAKLKGMMAGDKNPQWRGGKSLELYGYKFKRIIRHYIYERDNYTCLNCGVQHEAKSGLLVAHHKDADKHNCSLNNLVTLCRVCHGKITMGVRWSKEVATIQ